MTANTRAGEIVPDTKDWTWVLDRPCPECGLTASAMARAELPRRIRDAVPVWREVLAGAGVRARPRAGVWSPLEYACHARDAARIFDERLEQMLAEDGARFRNWDQNASAEEGRYDEQDPVEVSDELAEAHERIAARFATVADDQWELTGLRSNGSVFTVRTLGQYYVHDVVHHVWDVTGRRA